MTDQRWWHGGFPGLTPGDLLLPASTIDHPGALTDIAQQHLVDLPDDMVRGDRVHLTSDRNAARAFAACYPDGALYTAEPLGDTELDPDAPDSAIRCHQARIITVYDPVVRWAEKGDRWLNALTKGPRS